MGEQKIGVALIPSVQWLCRGVLLLAAAGGLAGWSAGAQAGDRPFSAITTAVAEEDDDNVWSASVVAQRLGSARGLGLEAEYAFNPTTSVQIGLGHARERGTGIRSSAVELELKHLFNHIARDGWGWGVSLSHASVKGSGESWRGGNWALVLPFSVQLGESASFVHANLGYEKSRGQRRERFAAIGIEHEVHRRFVLFAETAREGETRLLNVGVRHWIKREKWAIDLSAQRASGAGERATGWVLGLSAYDL